MSDKNHKDKPQDNPTAAKMIPDKDRIIEKGTVPNPGIIEPDRTDTPPEETPDTTPPNNPSEDNPPADNPPDEPEKE